MRIDSLRLQNFRGFVDREFHLHPQFNLVVGENGSGKTSLLEGLAVAAGAWLQGLAAPDRRTLERVQSRLAYVEATESWERQLPTSVQAAGIVDQKHVRWERTLHDQAWAESTSGIPGVRGAGDHLDHETVLPVLAYYRTDRNRAYFQSSSDEIVNRLLDKAATSRLSGYHRSLGEPSIPDDLRNWVVRQSLISLQTGNKDSALSAVMRQAILSCIPEAVDLYFDARHSEVVLRFADGARQTFSNLSDGQRGVLALVGDITQKAASLNPHLRGEVLRQTPGIVLIDELDLHLHPRWQRLIIDQLRECFPAVQFVCTTHSPFLIQSLRSGDELINLDGQTVANLADLAIEDIVRGIQGVDKPEVSARYDEMKSTARSYLERLDAAAYEPAEKLAALKTQLAEDIAPYADNPAFQAFLEMKRVARLGS